MGVTIKVVISVQENKEFFNVTEGELNWSDMKSMQDIVQKLLEENTEILTKYEKLT